MNKAHPLFSLIVVGVLFAMAGPNRCHADTPNVILILADDFGWGDASCNNPDSPLKTPAIDRIANEGIRFTNAHTPSAVCTPTRYGLLTGRYPWRSYLKSEVLTRYAPALITEDRTTIASYLKSQRYRTGGFGKWHLGLDWTPIEGDPATWRKRYKKSDAEPVAAVAKGIDHSKPFKNSPVDIGFDTYFGTPSNCGQLKFFIQDNRVFRQPKRDKRGVLRDPAAFAKDKVDDIYVAKAIGFIENHEKQHADRPFFVYLPLNAIHGVVSAPKRFNGKTGMGDREDKILWANESVNKILEALDRLKLADDTLLIFTTDNGPINSPTARKMGHEPTGPYRGVKTTVWDGGTRVPFVARWPGHIPVGATTDHLIGLTDVLATVAAVCGGPLPDGANSDSVNQLPALLQDNEKITQRPALVTASYLGFLTIRNDNWKAVFGTKWTGGYPNETNGGLPPKGTPPDDPSIGQLYNIANDPFEQKDLWESHPDVVKKLRAELERIKQLDKIDGPRFFEPQASARQAGTEQTLEAIRNPASTTVLIAAHRGGYENDKTDRAPENSIANIRNCENKGYELYETDIQRTKDGHFVIMHDPTINRETTGEGKVCDLNLAELKQFYKRYRNGSTSKERVATLDDFLQHGKGRTVFKADLKPGVSDHFKELMDVVVKHDALDGIIFRVPYKQADLFARYKADGGAYQRSLLMFKVSTKKQVDDIKARFDPRTIQVNVDRLKPATPQTLETIRYAARQGLLVQTHAEGNARDWSQLCKAGVRMFHTNKPAKMKAFLVNRPRHE